MLNCPFFDIYESPDLSPIDTTIETKTISAEEFEIEVEEEFLREIESTSFKFIEPLESKFVEPLEREPIFEFVDPLEREPIIDITYYRNRYNLESSELDFRFDLVQPINSLEYKSIISLPSDFIGFMSSASRARILLVALNSLMKSTTVSQVLRITTPIFYLYVNCMIIRFIVYKYRSIKNNKKYNKIVTKNREKIVKNLVNNFNKRIQNPKIRNQRLFCNC